MSILKIVTHPNDLLRQVSKEIAKNTLQEAKFGVLINDMTETMLERDGVGLAAPQIGKSIRLIIVNTKTGPMAMINPVIYKKSLSKEWDEEGCLSVPHTFGQVKRHKMIRCRFINEAGQERQIEAKGLLARVIQHEVDHLDGILFIDKARDVTSDSYAM
jgi:peptide deformylase